MTNSNILNSSNTALSRESSLSSPDRGRKAVFWVVKQENYDVEQIAIRRTG